MVCLVGTNMIEKFDKGSSFTNFLLPCNSRSELEPLRAELLYVELY